MVQARIQNTYTVATGASPTDIAVPVYASRDPSNYDVNYVQGKRWINTVSNITWELASFSSTSGTVLANWVNNGGNGSTITTLVVTADTAMSTNISYITNKAGTAATMTLPATATVGDIIQVSGLGATGFSIAQNAGQTIHYNSASTTTGVGGSLASTSQYDSITMRCEVTNTDFVVQASSGIFTIV